MNEESLFHLAREKHPHERAAFLNQACADDIELRRRVEVLLRAHEDPASLLDRPIVERAAAPVTEAETLAPGERPSNGLAPGTKVHYFGDYELLNEIARGGMGIVYRARQVTLNRIVALKMILSGAFASPDDVQRFHREAEAAANLDHANIVPIYEVGEYNAQHYFSMKLVEGSNLAKWIADCRESNADFGGEYQTQAVSLLITVARAVHHAHQRGILHRDLKPANILLQVSAESRPRKLHSAIPLVSDFGLAKRIAGEGDIGLTQSGAIVGTPSYMAPEQAVAKTTLTTAVDVYALGAILYELLTGQPPFRAATSLDTILQVIADEPVPLRQLNRRVPVDLETICHKCLQKDVAKRYASAAELADDLQRFAEGRPIAARPVSRLERLARWCRREPVVAGLLAAVLLVLTAGVVVSSVLGMKAARSASLAERKAEEAAEERERANEEALGAVRLAAKEKQAREAANREKDRANEQRDRAELLVYAGKLIQAQLMWKDDKGVEALGLLNECKWNLRGWEHRHLWTLYNSNQATFRGHTREVSSVAWSPDGKRILSGSGDKTLKVWNAEKGQEVLSLKGHTEWVSSVAWSPDGKRILSGSGDKTLKVWNAGNGQEVLSLKGHTGGVYSVAWSPDGNRILSGSKDKTVKVWDAQKGREVLSLKGHTNLVRSVAWSPDGNRILSGGGDISGGRPGEMKVWDAETGQEVLSIKGHTLVVMGVAWSPDGKRILSGSFDKTLKVWDAEKGQEVLSLKGHTSAVTSVAWSPDGKRIISGGWDNTVRVWDAEKGQEIRCLKGHTNLVNSVAWSPDGKRILSGSLDNTLKVWSVEKRQEVLSLKGHTSWVFSVAWSPDGNRILSGGGDISGGGRPGEMKVWDAETGQEVLSIKGHTLVVMGVAWSPDGKRILSGSQDNTLKVWDAQKGHEVLSLKGHTNVVFSVAWSPDGKRILSGSGDGTLKVWDAQKGQEVLSLKGHIGPVLSVAWSPNGNRILSGSFDKKVKVWDVQTGQEVLSLKGHTNVVFSVAWSPDGKRILGGSYDGTLKVWDAQTGQEVLSLKGHTGLVNSVAWSPDGRRILSGSSDNTLKVWDAQTGQEVLSLKGHTGGVSSVAWSPDGKRILSGSNDKTLKVWDAQQGQEVRHLRVYTALMNSVSWSPDGKRVSGKDKTGKVLTWDTTTGQLLPDADSMPKGQQTEAANPDGSLRAFIENSQLKVAVLDEQKRQQEQDRLFLERLARPDPAYHRQKADLYEKSGDLFAAAFHLHRLLLIEPKDDAVRKRLAAVEARLAAQAKAAAALPEKPPAKMP